MILALLPGIGLNHYQSGIGLVALQAGNFPVRQLGDHFLVVFGHRGLGLGAVAAVTGNGQVCRHALSGQILVTGQALLVGGLRRLRMPSCGTCR